MGEDSTRVEVAEQLGTLFTTLVTQSIKALFEQVRESAPSSATPVVCNDGQPLKLCIYLNNGKRILCDTATQNCTVINT